MTIGSNTVGEAAIGDDGTAGSANEGTAVIALASDVVSGVGKTSGVFGTSNINEEATSVSASGQQTVYPPIFVAFAFCSEPEPIRLSLNPIDFTSYCDFAGSELNINPVVFTAIGSQSDNVGPPVPPGSQLSFFWG